MRRQHEHVGAERGDIARHPPGHLHRVAEHEAVRGMDQRRGFRDRLDHAGLVICALQRQKRASGPAACGSSQSRSRRPSGSKGAASARRKPMPRQDAGMFAGGNDKPLERPVRSPPNRGFNAALAASVPPETK